MNSNTAKDTFFRVRLFLHARKTVTKAMPPIMTYLFTNKAATNKATATEPVTRTQPDIPSRYKGRIKARNTNADPASG